MQDFPYLVQLLTRFPSTRDKYLRCGATIIAPKLLLTAAHCFDVGEQVTADHMSIYYANAVRFIGDNKLQFLRNRVAQFWRHPSYDNDTLANDISVLKVGYTKIFVII